MEIEAELRTAFEVARRAALRSGIKRGEELVAFIKNYPAVAKLTQRPDVQRFLFLRQLVREAEGFLAGENDTSEISAARVFSHEQLAIVVRHADGVPSEKRAQFLETFADMLKIGAITTADVAQACETAVKRALNDDGAQ